jgi:hypothetical protein
MATKNDYHTSTASPSQFNVRPGTTFIAQQFTASADYTLTKIVLRLWRTGTLPAPDDVVVTVEGNTPGTPDRPDASALDTCTISGATLPASDGGIYTDFAMAGAASIVSGTKYWIVINVPSDTLAIYVRMKNDTDSGYAAGISVTSTSRVTWTDATYDTLFEVWGDISGVEHALAGDLVSASVVAGQFGAPTPIAGGVVCSSLVRYAKLQVPLGERDAIVPDRVGDYDSTKTWDEETKSWVSTRVIGPNNHKQTLVAVSELGLIYFGEM